MEQEKYEPLENFEKDLEQLYEKHKDKLSTLLIFYNKKSDTDINKILTYLRFIPGTPIYKSETVTFAHHLMDVCTSLLRDLKPFDPYYALIWEMMHELKEEFKISTAFVDSDKIDREEVKKKIIEYHAKQYEEKYRASEQQAQTEHIIRLQKLVNENPEMIKTMAKAHENVEKELTKEEWLRDIENGNTGDANG